MGQFAIGQPVPRTEDPRLLTGGGRYIDDFALRGQAHAVVVRAPHAHARILSIDTRAAQQMPGVLAVLTGADWAADGLGAHGPTILKTRRDGAPFFFTSRPPLPTERVIVVGEPVAFVVAETLDQAKDAAERVAVAYEPLPALIDTASAVEPGPRAVHPDCPDNEAFAELQGDAAAVAAAFARADHVAELKLVINRVTANTMEPRACIGDYDAREDRYTLYAPSQIPWGLKRSLALNVLHVPETRVRIVAGDVGGSFGMKGGHHPEYALAVWAARRVGRPVKWVCERSEGLLSDPHDRDQVTEAALALDREGRFLALRVRNICSVGAYLEGGGVISPSMHLGGLAGLYTTPAISVDVSAVFTNTASIGPFRGSGRPEATYVIERLIDTAAREMGIDRAEIRRRNLIPPEAMPFKTGLTYTYDCGEFPRNMEAALDAGGYAGFAARREAAAARGRLRGIGIANFVEQTAQAAGETVRVQFDPSGNLTVIAGSISHGQGHDTMYKVVLSDRLGIDADDIRVTFGDTDALPAGGGTYASRTAVLGGSAAALAADKVIDKGRRIAAQMLEAAEADIAFAAGAYRVAGTDRTVSIQDVARAAYAPLGPAPDIEPGLCEMATFLPNTPTFPNGCHVCEVEIDPETGRTEIVKYSVVDDVGTVINPLTLEGQIHGGIGQAVGQAFTEQIVYDSESGQLLTGSFLDYGMPRADDMGFFDCANHPVPTARNPLGVKGAGEAGNVGGLAAIMNAVVDALAPLGVRHIDMPATPEKVWRIVRDARGQNPPPA